VVVAFDSGWNRVSGTIDYRNSIFSWDTTADSRDRYLGNFLDSPDSCTISQLGAEQEFIILSAEERVAGGRFAFASERAIGSREGYSLVPNERASAASFADVTEVLQQAVTHVDHGRRQFSSRQDCASGEPRGGAVMSGE
jgi:hypothetical protein